MNSRESQPLTAPLTLPNNVGQSLLADDDIVSFLSWQDSQSFTSEGLVPPEASQGVPTPIGSFVRNDGVQVDTTKLMEDSHAQAGTNRTAWIMDIVAIFVASACLTSIYAILGSLNNKEQPQWPLPATLNLGALIALLATILRSMIMEVLESVISQLKWRWFKSARPLSHLEAYDKASRGPWGAAKFIPLFRLNWATWGAFVSVLSIAISTLTQQAFQTSACSQPISVGEASIPIAQAYLREKTWSSGVMRFLDPRSKTAFISGLTGNQLTRYLTPTCSSGNCTFAALNGVSYSSVVISTECIDVSPLVNQTGDLYWDADLADHDNMDTRPDVQYTVPFGMSLNYSDGWEEMISIATPDPDFYDDFGLSEKQKTTVKRIWEMVGIMMPTTNPCEDASAYQSSLEDESPYVILPPVDTRSCAQLDLPNVATLPGYFSVTAAVCWFYPALQQFTGTIQQGSFQEQTIGDPVPLLETGYLLNETGGYMTQITESSFSDPCIIEGSNYVPNNFSEAPGGLVTVQNDKVNVTGPLRCLYGLDYSLVYDPYMNEDFSFAFPSPMSYDCVLPAANWTEIVCRDKWWLANCYVSRAVHY